MPSSPGESSSADLVELVVNGLAARGRVTIPVSGTSMLPTLRSGERVVLYPVRPEGIRPQDVIAFRGSGRLVLHRVHVVFPDWVITAGDNYDLFDPPVPVTAVIGVARDVPGRPAPRRWPHQPGAPDADIWLIGGPDAPGRMEGSATPAGWRLHRRSAEGIGVSAEVLAELQAAAAGRPCVGVTERAVHAASDVLGGLPPQTQVLVGCSYGSLEPAMAQALPGHLMPAGVADVRVRLGPPGVPVSAADALRELAALVAPGDGAT
jgi:signal peptidase I